MREISEALMILLGEETSWRHAKISMSDPSFLLKLKKLRPRNLSIDQLKKLKKIINRPGFADI